MEFQRGNSVIDSFFPCTDGFISLMDPDPSFPIAKDSLMICMPHRLLKVKNTSSEVGMGIWTSVPPPDGFSGR
jgi:hypothetical protein